MRDQRISSRGGDCTVARSTNSPAFRAASMPVAEVVRSTATSAIPSDRPFQPPERLVPIATKRVDLVQREAEQW